VSAGDEVVIRREDRFVSRGGEKLDHALTTWRIDVAGLTVVDLGSSTGGFTDCLLQRGVKRVVAVDVGEHLLHEKIVADQRVEILAGVNVRDTHLLPARVADLVVVDLSFISVIAAIPAIQRVAVSGAMAIVLVKPQFEASRAEADRFKGVIEDPAIHERVLTEVEAAFGRVGCVARDRIESPVRGAKGNREFLLLLEIGSPFRGKD
jgi:23S rRNA (cytidine1920-2'-O)/16S rRNA (cytidine1409-2'-O)-methyltransferase